MNTETYLKIFLSGSGLLEEETDDSICLGTMLPISCEQGVEKVMRYHTSVIDALLQLPGLSALMTVQLLAVRGVTFHEFSNVLADVSIKEADFGKYPALRCLFLSSNKDRRERLIYRYNRDSYADYVNLLAQMLQHFHPLIFEFLFDYES